MNSFPNTELAPGTEPPQSLTKVLEQCADVMQILSESASALSLADLVARHELAELDLPPSVEKAFRDNADARNKLQEASEKLLVVTRAIEDESRDRHMLNHQFAAVTEQEAAARHAALHDVLTGLPNRALFNDRVAHGLAQAKRRRWTLALMFMDLNDFKTINDSYGHDVGDFVLRTIAKRLKQHARGDDTVSRHGGDEFLYLLTEIRDERDIALIAEKTIATIQAPCNVKVGNVNVTLSIKASIGISIFPKDGVTAEALLKRADEAMYRAKQDAAGYLFAS